MERAREQDRESERGKTSFGAATRTKHVVKIQDQIACSPNGGSYSRGRKTQNMSLYEKEGACTPQTFQKFVDTSKKKWPGCSSQPIQMQFVIFAV